MKGLRWIRSGAFVLVLLAGAANAAEDPPRRAGLIGLIAPQPVHVHIGVTLFGNGTREMAREWNIPSVVEDEFRQRLQSRGVELVTIAAAEHGFAPEDRILNAWNEASLGKVAAKRMAELTARHSLDLIFLARTGYIAVAYAGPSAHYTSGYGLLTAAPTILTATHQHGGAHAFSSFSVTVIDAHTLKLLGKANSSGGVAGGRRGMRYLESFPWPRSEKGAPEIINVVGLADAHFDLVKPFILERNAQIISEALTLGGVTTDEAPVTRGVTLPQ